MVSGASRGIGNAIARRLLQSGFNVSAGLRDPATAQHAFPAADRKRLMVCRYDARTRNSEHEWAAATATHFGRIDGLVNAAGVDARATILDADEAALDDLILVNLKGPLRVYRAAHEHLARSGAGRVVNVASLSGKRVANDNAGYAMTKFALVALTHSIRRLGWDHGIRATALCPGFVATDMSKKSVGRHPWEQMTRPEDLAEMTEMLLLLPPYAVVAELLVSCRLEYTM
jgi:NAD(P)-dependent dehydrogenase (short-subunit alcohol dehydrogenase family)